MKKIILLLLISIPFISKTQVVSATNMNILYANNIENPIMIAVPEINNSDLDVKFNHGKIKIVNKQRGEYIVMPNQEFTESNVSIDIYHKDKKISSHMFRVKAVAGLRIHPRFKSGEFTKAEIANNAFFAEIPNFEFPVKFYVSGFTVICIGTKRMSIKCKGNKISLEAKKQIQQLQKGQTVIFEDFIISQEGIGEVDRPNDKFIVEIK